MQMDININGEKLSLALDEEIRVDELLTKLSIQKDRIAFALNGSILQHDKYDKTIIKSGDKVEVVQLMAGG
jgi:thiamine biosynthesis protein ThiS